MTGKERLKAVFEYGSFDRVPNWEAGVWGQTRERWQQEGLAEGEVHWDWWKGEEYFGMDPRLFVPVDFDLRPLFEHRLIEETERYETYIDNKGRTRKALKEGQSRYGTRMSMDEFIAFPVADLKDFRSLCRRLRSDDESRYPSGWRTQELRQWKACQDPVILGRNTSTGGFYWRAREWMGTEPLSYAFYDQPELIHEMMEFLADFTMEVATPILQEMDFDYVMISEDMAMKSGPLLSPDTYRKFIFPHMKRLVDFLKSRGVRYVMVDTDGDPEPLLSLLLDAGVDGFWPIERAAEHMDPAALRQKYGKSLRLFGGVDKRVLARSEKEIDRHLQELAPLVEEGGFIPTVDHTVPPDVSLSNFMYYMRRKADLLSGKL